MVIGGGTLLVLNSISTVKQMKLLIDLEASLMLVAVIIVGTAAFTLFLGSMKYITPVEASVLSSFEPLTAMVVSMIWFGQILGMWQLSGAIIMLLGVTWISIAGSKIKT